MSLAVGPEIGSGLRVIGPVTLRAVGHWVASRNAGRRGIARRRRRIAGRRRIAVIPGRRARIIGSWVVRAVAVIGSNERTADHTQCNRTAPAPATSPLNLLDRWWRRAFNCQRVEHGQSRRNASKRGNAGAE